mgnify:CR=1 FL=1
MRYSPIIDVIEKLIGKGYHLKLYDKNVNLSKLIGQNKSYIMEKLPHIAAYLAENLKEVVMESELIILTNQEKEFEKLKIPKNITIIDLVRFNSFIDHPRYEGICW